MADESAIRKRPPPPPAKKPQLLKTDSTGPETESEILSQRIAANTSGNLNDTKSSIDTQPITNRVKTNPRATKLDDDPTPIASNVFFDDARSHTTESRAGIETPRSTRPSGDSTMRRLMEQLKQLQAKIEFLEDNDDTLRERVAELMENDDDIREKVNKLKETDNEIRGRVDELNEESRRADEEIRGRVEELRENDDEIRERVDELEEEKHTARSESDEWYRGTAGFDYKPSSCLNFISIKDWDKREFSRKEPHALIDVVVAPSFFENSSKTTDSTAVASAVLEDQFSPDGDHTEYIKFVQINSLPLVHLCYHIINGSTDPPTRPMIIFAPFKTFTAYEHEFEQTLATLGNKWAHRCDDSRAQITRQAYKSSAEDVKVDERKVDKQTAYYQPEDLRHDSFEAYLGARAWDEFFQSFVKKRWDFFRSDCVNTVRFGDLCNFFQPGDVVYQPDSPQKVWKIIKTTGGRPTLQNLLYGAMDVEDENGGRTENTDGSGAHKVRSEDKREDRPLQNDWTTLNIEGYYLDFDGTSYGPVHKLQEVKYYPGKKSVRNLDTWPLRILKHDRAQYDEMTEAGATFFAKCLPTLHHYEGRTETTTPSGENLDGKKIRFRAQDLTSSVYVDLAKAFQYNPDWRPKFGIQEFEEADNREIDGGPTAIEESDSKFRHSNESFNKQNLDWTEYHAYRRYRQKDRWVGEDAGVTKDRTTIEPSDHILFPNRLYGFVFQTRTWECLAVDTKYLKEVPQDDSAWGELALPKSYKRTLESLVELHFENRKTKATSGKAAFEYDFIHGKGTGLVVLLHGHPGVGKTSTAESIAAKYRKALLPITCGNLGIDAQSVEQALTENFQLAQAWDAIVLLDEADVFLTRRDKTDLQRNALVSVFLRTLEYYDGILFLTTNRIGAFDGAFISRVHASLYYPPLSEVQTLTIWESSLSRLMAGELVSSGLLRVDQDILSFARFHFYERLELGADRVWNGRQIRNAFQSAVALARYDSKKLSEKQGGTPSVATLTKEHFKVVAEASAEFENYLEKTRGTDDENMDADGERAKNYTTPTPLRLRYQASTSYDHQDRSDSGYDETMNTTPFRQNSVRIGPNGYPLTKKPTLNERLRQSVPSLPPNSMRGPPNVSDFPSKQPFNPRQPQQRTFSLPAGCTLVNTPQGLKMVPIRNDMDEQPQLVHSHTYQNLDHHSHNSNTIQHDYGDTFIQSDQIWDVSPQNLTRSPSSTAAYLATDTM